MNNLVRRATRKQINIVFGVIFGLLYVIAVLPPIYIAMNHVHTTLGGLAMTALYMILDPFVVGITLGAFWWIEKIRHEL